MSKLDKVKLVLEQSNQPLSIQQLTSMTRFDQDIVQFILDELKSSGKIKIDQMGNAIWASRQPVGIEMGRTRKTI